MAKTTKKKENEQTTVVVTRAEKKDATKNLIREVLAVKPYKHNELIEEGAKLYVERFGEGTENINDVKGRIGSVLDIMKKESDVTYEGGMYALKARLPQPPLQKEKVENKVEQPTEETPVKEQEEKPAPKKRGRKPKAKAEEKAEETVKEATLEPAAETKETAEVAPEEKPAPKKRGRKPKAVAEVKAEEKVEEKVEETTEQLTIPTEEVKEVKEEAPVEETPKAEEVKAEENITEEPKVEEVKEEEAPKAEEAPTAEQALVVKEKAEIKPVMDMSFLFGTPKVKVTESPVKETRKEEAPEKAKETKVETPKVEAQAEKQAEKQAAVKGNVTQTQNKATPKTEEKPTPKAEQKPTAKVEQKPAPKAENNKAQKTTAQKTAEPSKTEKEAPMSAKNVRKLPARGIKKTLDRPLTAEEKLREAFLKRLRTLGGDYFEYYSVYLLERYSIRNGRRLEGLRICGGGNDGGIDGEIELTDKLGFKETIYIQSKNWNPDKGDERLWIVGETLLQQFIGACACRQAKDGKQHCRGIFVTTSRFTPEAKRILENMSDKIVGYDGNDLFEAAKECSFGLTQKSNGEWILDEKLLSGTKAFFYM